MKIEGKNAVREALDSQSTVEKLLCAKSENDDIVALAKSKGVKVQFVDKKVLDKESVTGHHQGYVAFTTEFQYCDLEDLWQSGGEQFIVVLDGILDPHNFGSIIRVCECAGVTGVVIGKNRQVPVNETVVRCSAGAVSHVKIAKVTNVNRAIEELKKAGVWVYAADMDGASMYQTDLSGNVAIVIGGEGEGVSKLTRQLCDGVVSVPMKGKVNSLNASVACALVVYEAVRQRG